MNKILSVNKAIEVTQRLRKLGKTIVLAGGVFDILHLGHIRFLEKSKGKGDILLVLLESDQNAKRRKGQDRPIHTQKNRASVLSAIPSVDYIILLAEMTKDNDYDKLINQLKPDIIATTKEDPGKKHKERQAKLVGGKVEYVLKRIKNQSTTKMEKLIKNK